MRKLSAVLVTALAASAVYLVPAVKTATDCDPDGQCPASCKLFEQLFSRPICDGINGGGAGA